MNSYQLRKKFLDFFSRKNHKIVVSSSLVSQDKSVLFTTAGMQQFKEYFLTKESPYGKRVATCQKCFRTSDIDEVGDRTHLTFFEMLGNFSFGDYFKKEAIEYALKLLVDVYKIPVQKLWFTYFKGEGDIPEDSQIKKILIDLGITPQKIFGFGKEQNFWGPTGKEGPCGPSCEIHYDLLSNSCSKKNKCIPNCDCSRFLELWNLVFNEYYQSENGKISLLEKKGIDTGMGLERLALIIQKKDSVFETDLFLPIIKEIKINKERYRRIIADHIKGAVFLISEGILPSNVEQGYVLRRILRRAIRYGKIFDLPSNFLIPLAKKVVEIYKNVYPELKSKETEILTVIQNEEEKFEKTLERGLKQFEKLTRKGDISGHDAFYLFETYGFPLELTEELAKEKGIEVDKDGFFTALEKHREISRKGASKKFGGIGKEADFEATKLHTATHLLHSALREVLGKNVRQMGSDITSERLRFDFSYPKKLTAQQIKMVEDLVNQKISQDLEIKKEEMSLEDALKSGALAFFKEKYPEKVSVYSIYNPKNPQEVFSKEICAGPHVRRTSELGYLKIIKEESAGAGIRRIRAVLK